MARLKEPEGTPEVLGLFGQIVLPLTQLTSMKRHFDCLSVADMVFSQLKILLAATPLMPSLIPVTSLSSRLKHPHPPLSFISHTDFLPPSKITMSPIANSSL